MIDALGGRKSVAVLIMLVLGVGAVLLKNDVPPNFLQLLQFLFGAFVVGNGIEHAADAVQAGHQARVQIETSGASDETLAPKLDALAQTQAQMAQVQGQTANGVNLIQQALGQIIKKTGMDR